MHTPIKWTPDELLPGEARHLAFCVQSFNYAERVQAAIRGVFPNGKPFNEQLTQYREQVLGVSIRQFARMIDYSVSHCSRTERELTNVSSDFIERLLHVENLRSTRVVKISRKAGADNAGIIRIDRATDWGNPFRIAADARAGRYRSGIGRASVLPENQRETRAEAVRSFLEYALDPANRHIVERLWTLAGHALGCWCDPDLCHGHVYQVLIRHLRPDRSLNLDGVTVDDLWLEVNEAAAVALKVAKVREAKS